MAKTANPTFAEITESLARMGATALSSVESIRSRITALNARRSDLESAPCTAGTMRARAVAAVDDAVNDFRSSMVGDLLSAPASRFSDNRLSNAIGGLSAFALLAAVNRDGLVAALVADGEASAASAGTPVSEPEREGLLADLDRDLMRAEVEEELFLRQLEGAGLGANLSRRSGCNPAVVLAYGYELEHFLAGGAR